MLTTGKGTHYCMHCGFDMKAKEERECVTRDGDLCEAKKRISAKEETLRRERFKRPKYCIEGSSVSELSAKLVYLLKLENDEAAKKGGPNPPRVDQLAHVTACGSKVRISLSKQPNNPHVRRGIEIDGARLA